MIASTRDRPVLLGAAAATFVLVFVIAGLHFGILPVLIALLLASAGAVAIRGPLLRAATVLFGSIFAFQSEAVPFAIKAAFIVVAVAMAGSASLSISRRWPTLSPPQRRAITAVLWGCGALALLLGYQLLAIVWTEVSVEAWIRDVLNYVLLPVAVLVGIDAGLVLTRRQVNILALAVGLVGAFSVLSTWLQRRGGDDIGFEQFGLASTFTVFAGVSLCLSIYFAREKASVLWLAAALLPLGMLVATGGRQPVMFAILALATAAIFGRGPLYRKIARIATTIAVGVAAYLAMLEFSAAFGGGVAIGRLQFFDRLLSEGMSVIASDASALDRANAYRWLLEIWGQHPILGQGLGHYFPSVRTGLVTEGILTLDSPLVVLAKFGVIGTILLCLFLVSLVWGVLRLSPADAEHRAFSVLFVLLSVVLCLATVPNGFPTENRGFPSFVLLFMLVAFRYSWSSREPGGPGMPDAVSPTRASPVAEPRFR